MDDPKMKALLELLDQLLYMLEAHGHHDALPPAGRHHVRITLEALAREALEVAEGLKAQAQGQSDQERLQVARREDLLGQALGAIAYERYEEAERILTAALEEFPDHHEYYNHLGLIAWERDDMVRAEHYYAKAAALSLERMPTELVGDWNVTGDRSYLRALEGQALSLYKLGRLEEAAALFTTLACTCVPEYQGCSYLAGEIRHLQGDYAQALKLYGMAPLEPSVLYNRALAHFQLHELEQAAMGFIRAFESNPHICEALLGRPFSPSPELGGYVGSSTYAEEFFGACATLWQGTEGAREFMGRCFEDVSVQHSLWQHQHDHHGLKIPWLDPSPQQLQRVQELAQRVLERLYY